MSELLNRRDFLTRMWKSGIVLIGAAGIWTTWDLLQPLEASGFGGKVRSVPPDAVPDTGAIEVPQARSYLVRIDGEVHALSEKCTHLGCRVPFCNTSSQFECPCHGSVFNRAGDWREGPAPRGMDRYPIEVGPDGLIYIDTSQAMEGPAQGVVTADEPATGPSCGDAGGEA
ncbi:MAG: ubiquinol-cytochrome c reductase iron-sulfur subunit [Acidimicrobiia bacterium]|jgi:cytochrome b6-f complex iron-sulfur subunit